MTFEDNELQDMVAVGHTTDRSVRLWLRSTRPGKHSLELWRADGDGDERRVSFETAADPFLDGTATVSYPDDFEGAPPLASGTRYAYRVRSGERLVGEGGFDTSPASPAEAPDRFAFAVLSCHQPFTDKGEPHETSMKALRCLRAMLGTHDVKRLLLVGDQMYSDWPTPMSLFCDPYFQTVAPEGRKAIFDCTREEVRRLYQQRYRIFWKDPFFRGVQADYPSYPILDDHEIKDNFGSAPEHASVAWRNIREGAFDAYQDYQGLRVDGRRAPRPKSFFYTFDYGPVGVFVMDLRGQRVAGADGMQVYGADQAAALERWLADSAERQVLLIVTSVPIMHVPDFISDVGAWVTGESSDFADRWSYAKAVPDRDRLLCMVRNHQARRPAQKIVFVGGDIHVGAVSRFTWPDGIPPAYQLASSAVSNAEMPLLRRLATLMPMITRSVKGKSPDVYATCDMVAGEKGHDANPYGGLNIGMIEVERDGGGWAVRLALVSYEDEHPDRARVVYRSPVL